MTDYFEYLDMLRESGVTNMFGAAPYLQKEFGIDRRQARDVLMRWMRSFKCDVPASERAKSFT
jgi:hypothetical protein